MSTEVFSLLARCWRDTQTGALCLQIVQIETGNEVRLKENTFLLRIFTDQDTAVERCLIRHLASGREVYMQGGTNLRFFINACLLDNNQSQASDSDHPGSS